ncbi:unnamed protein product, partial [Allacma fusca]
VYNSNITRPRFTNAGDMPIKVQVVALE